MAIGSLRILVLFGTRMLVDTQHTSTDKLPLVSAKYFSSAPPARTAYAAKELPLGAKVEIEAIAEAK